jgi:hypothetical protein
METIICSPLLICRTKYIDYPTGKPFCCPEDLDLRNFELLVAMMRNGDNLSPIIRSCKIFINDGVHCIIGKYGKLSVFLTNTDKAIDLSLDKATGGREPWGFIGAVIKTSDFISFGKGFDFPDSYYLNTYEKYLYYDHWIEQQFIGTYHYPYVEEAIELIDITNSNPGKSENGYIIEIDDKNSSLFTLAVECALKGEKVSFCTNAEYNASRLIFENKVDIVTVSAKNLNMHKAELQKSKKKTQKKEKFEETEQKDTDFDTEKRYDNVNENNVMQNEFKQDIHYFKLFSLYCGYGKIENSSTLFEFRLRNYCFFCSKEINQQFFQKEKSVVDKNIPFRKSKIDFKKNKNNSNKGKYKF